MFRFQEPQYLWLLSLLAVFIVLFIVSLYTRKRKLKNAGDHSLIQQLIPDYSRGRRIWKIILFCIAWTSMVTGLARPQFGSKLNDVTRQGVEIIFAFDFSKMHEILSKK